MKRKSAKKGNSDGARCAPGQRVDSQRFVLWIDVFCALSSSLGVLCVGSSVLIFARARTNIDDARQDALDRNSLVIGTVVKRFRIELRSEFGETSVHGDWAHCWCRLWVTMTPAHGSAPMHRSGHTLAILRKLEDGAWVIARDANLLAADAPPT